MLHTVGHRAVRKKKKIPLQHGHKAFDLNCFKKQMEAGRQWLMPVVLATWEAEIMRTKVTGQLQKIVHDNPSPK
jgi:hypothetical protein